MTYSLYPRYQKLKKQFSNYFEWSIEIARYGKKYSLGKISSDEWKSFLSVPEKDNRVYYVYSNYFKKCHQALEPVLQEVDKIYYKMSSGEEIDQRKAIDFLELMEIFYLKFNILEKYVKGELTKHECDVFREVLARDFDFISNNTFATITFAQAIGMVENFGLHSSEFLTKEE